MIKTLPRKTLSRDNQIYKVLKMNKIKIEVLTNVVEFKSRVFDLIDIAIKENYNYAKVDGYSLSLKLRSAIKLMEDFDKKTTFVFLTNNEVGIFYAVLGESMLRCSRSMGEYTFFKLSNVQKRKDIDFQRHISMMSQVWARFEKLLENEFYKAQVRKDVDWKLKDTIASKGRKFTKSTLEQITTNYFYL